MPRTKKTDTVETVSKTAKTATPKAAPKPKTSAPRKPSAEKRIEELEKKLENAEKNLKLLVSILHRDLKKGQPQGPEGLAKVLAGSGLLP